MGQDDKQTATSTPSPSSASSAGGEPQQEAVLVACWLCHQMHTAELATCPRCGARRR
jgi:uncharacterized paraquat-inducible protein A